MKRSLRSLLGRKARTNPSDARRNASFRLDLEALEDRTAPAVTATFFGGDSWTSPGPVHVPVLQNGTDLGVQGITADVTAGAVSAILPIPNTGIVYVGTVGGGIWRTDNIAGAVQRQVTRQQNGERGRHEPRQSRCRT